MGTTAGRPRSAAYGLRRVHRVLGAVIGVQFVLWTLGGLYFSWNDLDRVHGDHLLRPRPKILADAAVVAPRAAIAAIAGLDSVAGVTLLNVLGRPVYRVEYFTRGPDGRAARTEQLVDATAGRPRPPLDSAEGVAIARGALAVAAPVSRVELVTPATVGHHHEYRGQPLPAWAVTFAHAGTPTLYVPTHDGYVSRVRTAQWRAFDVLWMLHTMDYRGRDDFNNVLLRALSILGLATVASGLALFVMTARAARRRRSQRAAA